MIPFDLAEPTLISQGIDAIIVLISLWYLVELGLLKGTQGPNAYGPDPLGQERTDASLG